MTDLEIMQRAKSYLEKMANGIDPLTDIPVSNDDLINNVRISRCLFYTADVLRQVIELGGLKPRNTANRERSGGKISFTLPEERRMDFAFETEALPLSVITRKINDLINEEEMHRLRAKSISTWLVREGFLKEVSTESGNKVKRPSDAGKLIGIYASEQMREDRKLTMILYPREAQEFILDHLDSIIEVDREFSALRIESKRNAPNRGQPWDIEQEQLLVQLYKEGRSASDIARQFGRSRDGICARLKKLGLIEKRADV